MGLDADRVCGSSASWDSPLKGREYKRFLVLDPFNLLFLIGQSSAHGALILLHFKWAGLPGQIHVLWHGASREFRS